MRRATAPTAAAPAPSRRRSRTKRSSCCDPPTSLNRGHFTAAWRRARSTSVSVPAWWGRRRRRSPMRPADYAGKDYRVNAKW